MPDSVAAALVGLGLLARGRIFQFFIMFIIVLFDFIYALPEFCSVVSHEMGCLQWLRVFMQFIVALGIGTLRRQFSSDTPMKVESPRKRL
jgi:hypothetical protein